MDYIKFFLMSIAVGLTILPGSGLAQVATGSSAMTEPSISIGLAKVVSGLLLVLLVIAISAWLMKKFVQVQGKRPSLIQIVGGVSVGNRERVVVLEVSGRWLVVGVSAGQVNAIANLEVGDHGLLNGASLEQAVTGTAFSAMQMHPAFTRMANHTFANWLKKSLDKTTT